MLNYLFRRNYHFRPAASDRGFSRENEKQAREMFAKHKSVEHAHIHDCGLVVNNAFPFIAASPDGKICENGECGLLEIKCPFLARDMFISEAFVQIFYKKMEKSHLINVMISIFKCKGNYLLQVLLGVTLLCTQQKTCSQREFYQTLPS